jgi:WD40 repeat protein
MADVFISYSRKDKDFVARLQAALEEHEREPWLDTKDIPPTAEWLQEIYGAIEKADSFVFVISPEVLTSKVCQLELAHAVKLHKRLIPVVRRDVAPKDVPDILARLNWVFCRQDDDFPQALQTVLTAMATDLDHVRAHTRLLLKALEWEGRGRDKSLLLRGGELQRAEAWLADIGDREPRPTPLMLQFAGASRQGATARQRLTLGAVSFALVVAVSLALAAFYQYREARSQKESALARQLTAQSELLRSQQPHLIDRSVLLAVESLRRRATLEGSLALQRGLELLAKPVNVMAGETKMRDLTISPDGKWVAGWTEPDDKDIPGQGWIWETATGRRAASLPQVTNQYGYLLVAFSPDSKRLISLDEEGGWRQTAVADGREISRGTLGLKELKSAALSPDGNLMAVGARGKNRAVIVYELSSGREVARLPLTGWLMRMVFTPDSSELAVSCDDGTIKLWQVHKATSRASFKDIFQVGFLVVSPDGQYLAAGTDEAVDTEDTEICLCHLPTGQVAARLSGKGPCYGLEFSRNGLMMTAASDGVAVWRPKDVKEVFRVKPPSGTSAAISPDGGWLAVGMGDQAVQVYDLASGKEARRLSQVQLGSLVFSPDSRRLYTQGQGGIISWQFDGFQEVVRLPHHQQAWNPIDFAFSPDGKLLASSDPQKDLVYLWDPATGNRRFSLDRLGIINDVPRTHQVHGEWQAGVFSPDSQRLVLEQSEIRIPDATTGGEIAKYSALGIYDTATGKLVSRITGLDAQIAVGFRPGGLSLLTTGSDGVRKVWNPATGALQETIPAPVWLAPLQVKNGLFSPEGKWFCGHGQDQIPRVWEVSTGREVLQLGPQAISPNYLVTVFSSTGQYLAVTRASMSEEGQDDSPALVWEVASGRQLASVAHPRQVTKPVFDPTGRLLAVATRDNFVHVVELATGHERARLKHEAAVTGMAFSGDGQWLATGSKDHTARVWAPASGHEVARLEHPHEVMKVAFSPDGRILATSSQDGQVRLWRWRLDELMAAACARLARNLSREEWREYLGEEPYRLTCPNLPGPEK